MINNITKTNDKSNDKTNNKNIENIENVETIEENVNEVDYYITYKGHLITNTNYKLLLDDIINLFKTNLVNDNNV